MNRITLELNRLKNIPWVKIAKGAAIAGAGAVLTYLSQELSGHDFGDLQPVVAAVLAVLVNIVRKYLAGEE